MDDAAVFWQNDETAKTLFYDLLARTARGAYDDDFLRCLAVYRKAAGESEKPDIFAAQYLLHHGDAERAVLCGERAFRVRPVNYEVWKVLARSYQALGREMDAIDMQGRARGLYDEMELSLRLTPETVEEGLGRLSFAAGKCLYAPICKGRFHVKDGKLALAPDVFIGEEIPFDVPPGSHRFWSAVYTENAFLSERSYMMEAARHEDWLTMYEHYGLRFHLQKAAEVRGTQEVRVEGSTIVPIAGTERNQKLTITTASEGTADTYLGKWAFSYLRFEEDALLHADPASPYAVGTPIRLGHSDKRRKLVLNIFVDGLSWAVARGYAETHLPHTMRFFARGVVFDQHFSTSEHTLPAHPAIETGYYPHRTHIFNANAGCVIPADMTTIAEHMTALGYYAAAPMACSQGFSHGILRGFDRLVVSSRYQHASFGVESTIRHIRAFDEADQFLFLLINDVHPYSALGFKPDLAAETHLPLRERCFAHTDETASVWIQGNRLYQTQYLEQMQQVDLQLGILFSYLETHFDEAEYLVSLYSDHGTSVFGTGRDDFDVISENSTSAAWMMRGAGVPQGRTADELTSAVDIYPTLGHLLGFPVSPAIDGVLPKAFGGAGRDVAYAASQYPGQTFKLAARTKDYALRLETREVTDEDGTVDFAGAQAGIYPRGMELAHGCEIDSEALRAFFYPRTRAFVRSIANNGEFWPSMRDARPEWYQKG